MITIVFRIIVFLLVIICIYIRLFMIFILIIVLIIIVLLIVLLTVIFFASILFIICRCLRSKTSHPFCKCIRHCCINHGIQIFIFFNGFVQFFPDVFLHCNDILIFAKLCKQRIDLDIHGIFFIILIKRAVRIVYIKIPLFISADIKARHFRCCR